MNKRIEKTQIDLSNISNHIIKINTNGYKRIHDKLYLYESNLNVKQSFVEVADAIEFKNLNQ